MNNELQLNVQAYLDNELAPGEARRIAGLLSSDPEARALYNELKETKAIVAGNEPVLTLPESRDFYWSKIQRELGKTEQVERPAATNWWLRLLAPLAGAAALFAILVSITGDRPSEQRAYLDVAQKVETTSSNVPMHEGEVIQPDMSAITFRSEAEGVTVIWVSDIPDATPAPALLEWFE